MEAAAKYELREHDDRPCRLEDLVELAIDALGKSDLASLLERAVDLVAGALGAQTVSVVEFTGEGDCVVRARRGPVARAGAGSALRADIVGADDRLFGVLAAFTAGPRRFSFPERRCLQLVADLIAGAVRRIDVEASLRDAEARRRALVEQLPLTTYTDVIGERIASLFASPQIEALTGYAPEEWLADEDLFTRVLHPDDRERVLREHEAVRRSGEVLESEYRLLHRDGRIVHVQDRATLIRDASGTACLQGVLIDVTDRRRLETHLAQSQKLEAIGQLAAGVAHDFNNLLTAIIGYAELALSSLEYDSPVRAEVEEIAATGRRGALLTRQLLTFARGQDSEPVPVRVDELVARVDRLLRRLLTADVEFATRLCAPGGVVCADPAQLEQIVVNLAVNARDAMPEGGTLLIETHVEPGVVVITVSDTGVGMDDATQERIFEPFFTTKGPERGTGLGLSTVYGIVTRANGTIDVTTSPGRGATFRITLPAHEEEASQGA